MKDKIYLLAIFIFSISFSAYAQKKYFKNREYQYKSEKYILNNVDDSKKYEVVGSTIMVKYKSTILSFKINSFQQQNDLTVLRKAKTGWYDLKITNNKDLIDVANSLLNSPAGARVSRVQSANLS